MKILITVNVTPEESTDPAALTNDVAGAVAASVQAIPAVQSVEVAAIETAE